MPCINSDGTLSESAKALLEALQEPLSAGEISARLGKPVYWVRMSVRELAAADLVRAEGQKYLITERGREKLQRRGGGRYLG